MQTFFCFFIMAAIPLSLRLFKIPRWSPAYVFCLFWWAQFAVCYLLFPNTPWSDVSALFFMACSVAVIVGFRLSYNGSAACKLRRAKLSNEKAYLLGINYDSAKTLIVIFTILGFIYAVQSVSKYGFSLKSFFDVDTLLQMNNKIATARYDGSAESTGILNQVLLSFTYVAPMAGGCFYPYAVSKTDKLVCFVTFIPELIVLLSQNLKAGFVACIIFWLSGFLVSKIRIQGKIRIPFATLIKAGLIICVVVLVLMSTMVFRTGKIDDQTFGIVQRKFINYLFGHVGAIDYWINNNMLQSQLTLGGQTFIGITRYLGFSDRSQGIYIDNYVGTDLSTNVFTYFRGIYQDFGLIGSIIFFLTLGIVMGYAYKRLIHRYSGRPFAETILVVTYSFSLFVFVSIFSYASFLVAFALFFIFSYFMYSPNINFAIGLPRFKFSHRK